MRIEIEKLARIFVLNFSEFKVVSAESCENPADRSYRLNTEPKRVGSSREVKASTQVE